MDKPRQSDSFAEHVEGQIDGIAFGSVGALLYKPEGKGRKQQQHDESILHKIVDIGDLTYLVVGLEIQKYILNIFLTQNGR